MTPQSNLVWTDVTEACARALGFIYEVEWSHRDQTYYLWITGRARRYTYGAGGSPSYLKERAESHHAAILAAIEEAKEKWVPVTERLPEKEGYYSIFLQSIGTVTGYFLHGEWSLPDLKPVFPTHWQPLPQPPKDNHHE